jgi:cytochrome c-type biogenesis protein CcmH/NrfG
MFGYLGVPGLDGASLAPLAPDDERRLAQAHREVASLVAEKEYPAAIAKLRPLVRNHPEIGVLQYQLGTLLSRAGRFDQADVAFRAASRLDPDSPSIALAHARMLLDAGRLDAARDRASRAVALTDFGDRSLQAASNMLLAQISDLAQITDAQTQAEITLSSPDAP